MEQTRGRYAEHLVLSLLAELVVSSLVHQLLQLVGVRQLPITPCPRTYLELHEPSLLHGGLVHQRGSLRQNLRSTQPPSRTVFTSRTFPVAGQKASEAAFTDSTEEKESLTIKKQAMRSTQP